MHINYYQENELKFRLKLNITFIEEGYLLVTAEDTSAEIHIKELHSFSKSSTYIQKSKKYGIGTKFENGFYIWSDGLYKIIDRKPLSYDKMHNIIYELIIPEERAKLEKFKQNLIDHPEKSCKDYFKILTNSNKTKTILLDIKKIFENNHLKKTAIIVHDVTEELETEKRYNILNDLNSFIYNNLNIASFIISYETNYYYASKNISEMFHLSKKHPKLMLYDLLNNIIDTEFKSMREQIHNNEISLIDGIYDYKSPIYDKVQKIQITYFKREYNGETYYVGGMRDITQEIEKENKILAANKNIELLINESNHRIKNNLNLLLRFISLEEKFHKQPAKIIDNLIGRINSLVLLHEKLSYTENNYDVNAVESFKKMTEDLYYTFNEQSSEITFKFDEYEEFKLPNDKMTPVLLILNEIVTNTFKYAYTSE